MDRTACRGESKWMKIAVTGASGLIGTALVPALEARGHRIVRVVRASEGGPDRVRWDPERGALDAEALAGVDAAVNLAGEPIGKRRWSARQKARILNSRVRGTETLARDLAALDRKSVG